MFFLGEVFKQYQRARKRGGASGGEGEGPQPDKMATHNHRHYRRHRHSGGCRIGTPDRPPTTPARVGVWREGGGKERGEGVGRPHRPFGSVL